MKSALQPYFGKRDFKITSEPQGGKASKGALDLRDPEARREPPALRLPPRARRHAEELGGAQGAEPRPRRQAHGGARRGPSDRLRRLRGHDPEGPVRRRQGDRLGQRHLGAGRRRARRLPRRQAQVPPRRQEAARRLDAGAHARPRRRAPGAVAADQGARRGGAAGGRVQRRRRRADERALGPDHRRRAAERRAAKASEREDDRSRSSAPRRAAKTRATSRRRPRRRRRRPPRAPSHGIAAPAPIAAAGRRGQGDAAATLRPQLATLVAEPPSDAGWIYEIKFDGYRIARPHRRRRRAPLHAPRQRLVGAHAGAGRGGALARPRLGLARRRDRRHRRATARPTSTPCRTRSTRRAPTTSSTSSSTCPTTPATTCAACRWSSAARCSRRCSTARRRRSASASARTSTRARRSCCRTPAGCASRA